MLVDSPRRVDLHAGWVEVALVRLSWATASRHGVVAHHRYERARPANRGQPLQKRRSWRAVRAIRVIERSIRVIAVEGQGMRW
jgi:hypothetical protein